MIHTFLFIIYDFWALKPYFFNCVCLPFAFLSPTFPPSFNPFISSLLLSVTSYLLTLLALFATSPSFSLSLSFPCYSFLLYFCYFPSFPYLIFSEGPFPLTFHSLSFIFSLTPSPISCDIDTRLISVQFTHTYLIQNSFEDRTRNLPFH